MSLKEYRPIIKENDEVIIYFGFNKTKLLRLKKGETYQTRVGAIRHNHIIGKRYGCRIQCAKGWINVLHITPELWTVNLPHRTQILYSTDISMIMMHLDVKPGSIIVESGTGSGSLSHAFIRTIAPNGHLHTFDFHEERSQKAQQEFADHDIGDLVTCRHRDVCEDGFDLDGVADAVFLDLPKPWLAVPHGKKALKLGGRLCSFSPCIEQVQNTCETLQELGFTDLVTIECLCRDYMVHTDSMSIVDMGLHATNKDSDADVENDSDVIMNTENVDNVSQDNADSITEDDNKESSTNDKKGDGKETVAGTSESAKDKKSGTGRKRKYVDDGKSFVFKSAIPVGTIPGHTGYLTFATLFEETST